MSNAHGIATVAGSKHLTTLFLQSLLMTMGFQVNEHRPMACRTPSCSSKYVSSTSMN